MRGISLKQNWKTLAAGLLGFVFVAAPAAVVIRTAAEDGWPGWPVAKAEFAENAGRMHQRLSQSKITSVLVTERAEQVGFKGFSVFYSEQKQVLMPRFLNPDKPSFRPGEVIYNTFISAENPKRYSYPCSPAGESFWYFGNWAFLVVPVLAALWSGSVLLWSRALPPAVSLPLAIVALNTETHLFFLFGTQVRFVLLAAGIFAGVWLWKKRRNR